MVSVGHVHLHGDPVRSANDLLLRTILQLTIFLEVPCVQELHDPCLSSFDTFFLPSYANVRVWNVMLTLTCVMGLLTDLLDLPFFDLAPILSLEGQMTDVFVSSPIRQKKSTADSLIGSKWPKMGFKACKKLKYIAFIKFCLYPSWATPAFFGRPWTDPRIQTLARRPCWSSHHERTL